MKFKHVLSTLYFTSGLLFSTWAIQNLIYDFLPLTYLQVLAARFALGLLTFGPGDYRALVGYEQSFSLKPGVVSDYPHLWSSVVLKTDGLENAEQVAMTALIGYVIPFVYLCVISLSKWVMLLGN